MSLEPMDLFYLLEASSFVVVDDDVTGVVEKFGR
jgi:hypothetical protein